jgi:hypothetical protein
MRMHGMGVMDTFRAVRPVLAATRKQLVTDFHVHVAVLEASRTLRFRNGLTDDPPKRPYKGLFDCWLHYEKAIREAEDGSVRSPADFAAEVVFLEVPDATYMILYAEREAAYADALKSVGVEEYAYWDNTDRPDHLSDDDWAARAALWTELLPPGASPADVGPTTRVDHNAMSASVFPFPGDFTEVIKETLASAAGKVDPLPTVEQVINGFRPAEA